MCVFLMLSLLVTSLLPKAFSGETVDASDLMAQVRANLPVQEVDVVARLQTRNRQGDVRNEQIVDLSLRLGEDPPAAHYILRSRFGDFRQGVDIHLNASTGIPELLRRMDEAPPAEPVSGLYESIEDTEISWLDVSFGFLWWPGGQISGNGKKLGRACTVVDLPCPDPTAPYGGVRLWIDPDINAVLEIEVYDQSRQRAKRLRVKSLRKLDEKWFIKELEVLNVNTFRRTHIILNW